MFNMSLIKDLQCQISSQRVNWAVLLGVIWMRFLEKPFSMPRCEAPRLTGQAAKHMLHSLFGWLCPTGCKFSTGDRATTGSSLKSGSLIDTPWSSSPKAVANNRCILYWLLVSFLLCYSPHSVETRSRLIELVYINWNSTWLTFVFWVSSLCSRFIWIRWLKIQADIYLWEVFELCSRWRGLPGRVPWTEWAEFICVRAKWLGKATYTSVTAGNFLATETGLFYSSSECLMWILSRSNVVYFPAL